MISALDMKKSKKERKKNISIGSLTVGLFHPFLTPFSIILDFILIPFSSKNEAENETRKDMKMFIFDKMEP
jgi:hypothetical protein